MTSMKRKHKRSKGALLIRRIAIVATFLLILFLLGRGILWIVKLITHDQEDVVTINLTTEPMVIFVPEQTTEMDLEETTSHPEETTEVIESEGITSENDNSENASSDPKRSFNQVEYYIESRVERYAAYASEHPLKSDTQIVLEVNMNHDFPFYENIQPAVMPNDLWVLCNKYYKLDASFTPENLVDVKEGYYVNDGKTYQLSSVAHEAFIKMADAAKKDGLNLKIISAYRTNNFQANLYEKYKDRNGQTAADRFSARPGHSEHETGLAIDINDVSSAFENTAEFKWLQKNAHLYGFILRYPKNSEHITGYMYESWHYRYVGEALATELVSSDLTFDAYHATVLYERYK